MIDIGVPVERHPHGLIVRTSPFPASVFGKIGRLAEETGYDQLDPGIAAALGVSLVLVSKASGEAWRAEIERDTAHLPPLARWLARPDQGVSSRAIARVLGDRTIPADDGSPPRDGADFGRCYRLLQLFPDWRDRLDRVAHHLPQWTPVVAIWDDLVVIWEGPLDDEAKHRRIYDRLRAAR